MRRRRNDIALTYLGRVVPLSHEGAEPMLVTYRLLTPLTGDLRRSWGFHCNDGSDNGAMTPSDYASAKRRYDIEDLVSKNPTGPGNNG